MTRLNEPPQTQDLPDGYYLISTPIEPQVCLVYLYDCEDFNGVRHLAWQIPDGSCTMPVTHLTSESVLTPAAISVAGVATTNRDLDKLLKAGTEKVECSKEQLRCVWHVEIGEDPLMR